MPKLIELLKEKGNNYSELEEKYIEFNGQGLHYNLEEKNFINESEKNMYSVIVPSYRFPKYLKGLLLSLENQNYKGKLEVIVITDASKNNEQRENLFLPEKYKLKFIKLKERYSRSIARNIGLAYAKGSMVSFIDSDMILPQNFIRENMVRMKLLDKLVLTGMYKNILTKNYDQIIRGLIKENFNFNQDYKKDFRYKKRFGLEDKGNSYNISKNSMNKTYNLLKHTDNFKTFGFYKKYGIWRLPWMTLTIALSLKKRYALDVGGFNSQFEGWGFEDTHFGAKLIANDIFVVPLLNCVTFRVKHPVRYGSLEQKHIEARKNYSLFRRLLNEEFDNRKLSREFKKEYSIGRLKKRGIVLSNTTIRD